MKDNIILIGMPGAGKSTLGVVLAKAIGLQFIDTDLTIQQKTGVPLQQTINEKGIDIFLETEQEVICSLNLKGYVIATGGSVVMSQNAMEHLKSIGTIIYIDLPLNEIKKRINNIKTRGIAMKEGEAIDDVYHSRLPLYQKYADITVTPKNLSFEEVLESLIKTLK